MWKKYTDIFCFWNKFSFINMCHIFRNGLHPKVFIDWKDSEYTYYLCKRRLKNRHWIINHQLNIGWVCVAQNDIMETFEYQTRRQWKIPANTWLTYQIYYWSSALVVASQRSTWFYLYFVILINYSLSIITKHKR